MTNYVYGTATGGITPDIWRNDLLRAEIYPDSDDTTSLGDGADGIYDRVEYKYNRQEERIWKKDQNGTIHEYEFDPLGRDMADKVTSVASGVDDAVLRIAKSYEVRGMVDTITSHSTPAAAGSSSSSSSSGASDVVNEVTFEYTDAALLDKEYQEHEGAKDANTPYVGYNYDTTASGGEFTKGLRPTSLRYPDGRLVHNTYGTAGSTADAINRIAAIKDDSGGSPGTSLAEYSYLGADSIVQVDYPEPDLRYDLAHGTGDDPYDGPMDGFGRVTDLLWRDYGSSTDAVRTQHGYDRAGNRLYREDPVAAANGKDFDELYTYDGINQLETFQRGNLNATKDGLVGGTKNFAQDWTLDPTGNWQGFKEDDDGDSTWDLNQSRTSNPVNEITDITESTGPAWITPAYSLSGNMTTIPKPSDLTAGYAATYDAWNRLVKVADGANTVAEYEYDGRDFRIVQKTYAAGETDETRHYYYNKKRQCLEERVDGSSDAERHFVWGKRSVRDLICRDRDTSDPWDGILNERLFAMQGFDWSVLGVCDDVGEVRERFAYETFGGRSVLSSAFLVVSASSYDWCYAYHATRLDTETGLGFRTRYSSHQLGRSLKRQYPKSSFFDSAPRLQAAGGDTLGSMRCDPLGGPPIAWIKPKQYECIHRCIEEHELVHKRDLLDTSHPEGACCKKMQEAFGQPGLLDWEKAVILAKYNEWVNRQHHVDISECKAARVSIDCALFQYSLYNCICDPPLGFPQIKDYPGDRPAFQAALLRYRCCENLPKYRKSAEEALKEHCARAEGKEYDECPRF